MRWLLLAIILTVSGCSDRYDTGYRQGIVNTTALLRAKEQKWRSGMLDAVPLRIVPGVATILLVLLFGDRLVNITRRALWKYFHFTRQMQTCCFQWAFRLLILLTAGWTVYRMPFIWFLPLLPLLLGMTWLTECEIPQAFQEDRPESLKLVLTKLKTLLFFSLTLLFLYELLSGKSVIKLLPC